MECHSLHVAEHVAAVFGLALLFNICKSRNRADGFPSGCSDWRLLATVGLNKGDGNPKLDRRSELPDEFAGL